MALGKQAKVVKRNEVAKLLDHVSRSRHPERDRVIVLLSFKGGLRAKEIAELTWSMVTDTSGEIGDVIEFLARFDRCGIDRQRIRSEGVVMPLAVE